MYNIKNFNGQLSQWINDSIGISTMKNVGIGTASSRYTLNVAGNIYASNSVTTSNINLNNLTIAGSQGTNGQTLITDGIGSVSWGTVSRGGSSQWSNVYTGTQNNIYFVNQTGIGASTPPTATLMVTGNIYASNALTTTNVYAATTVLTGTTGKTSLNVTGNIYASNALTTTNVYASTTVLKGTTGQTTLNVTGNIYASNALTTTNVYASTTVLKGTTGQTTLNVTGNIYASNALSVKSISCSSFYTGTTGEPPPAPELPLVLGYARSTAVNSMGGDWVAIGNHITHTVTVYYKGDQFGPQFYINSRVFGAFVSLSGTGGILAVGGANDEIHIYKRTSSYFEMFNKINTSLLTKSSNHIWMPTLNRDGDKFVCSDYYMGDSGSPGNAVTMFTFNTNSGGTPTMSVDYANSVSSHSYISGDGKYVVIGVIYSTSDITSEMFVYNYGNSTPINVIPIQGFDAPYKITTTYNCDTIAVTYKDKVEVYTLNIT